jgi:hypothetical protein
MDNKMVFRLGGIAAFLVVILSLAYYVLPVLFAVAALCLAVFVFALFRAFSSINSSLNMAAAILGIGGGIGLAIATVLMNYQTGLVASVLTWLAFFSPPLLYGFLAYQNPQAGFSRILAILGILGGLFGLLNLVVVMIGGGDWANPSNPSMGTAINLTYYPGLLLALVWLVWSGLILLRKR